MVTDAKLVARRRESPVRRVVCQFRPKDLLWRGRVPVEDEDPKLRLVNPAPQPEDPDERFRLALEAPQDPPSPRP